MYCSSEQCVRMMLPHDMRAVRSRAVDSPMPDPAIATEGVFAETWEPLGDGQAPWSHWQEGPSADRGIPGREAEEMPRVGVS